MLDSEYHEDWRHGRPLPVSGEWPPRHAGKQHSLLSIAAGKELRPENDAATRHRLARLQRRDVPPALADDFEQATDEADYFENARFSYDDSAQAEWLSRDETGLADEAAAASGPASAPMRGGIARSKRLIAACGILGAAIGGLVALSLPARYDATTELQFTAGSAATGAGIADQLRIATSGIVLNKAIDKLGLANDPDFNGAAGDGGFVALARSLILRSDGAAASDAGQRHALAASHLADGLSVGLGSGPATIAITAHTGNGEKSALIANTVAAAFLETAAAIQAKAVTQTKQAAAPDDAARKLDVFLANHGLTSADGRAAADALLKLDGQLTAARARTAEIRNKVGQVRALGVDAAAGGGLPQEFESGAMSELRAQYLAIKRESDRAEARLGPRNPERIALDTQLSGARDRIAAELRRIVAALQGELKEAVQAEQDLASRLAQTKLAADDIATLRSLREAAGTAEVPASQSHEAAAAPADGIRIVARAYAPLEPSGPPRLAITLAGLLLGIGAGIGLGAARGERRPAEATGSNQPETTETAATGGRLAVDAPVSAVRQAMPVQHSIDAGGAELSSPETAETPYALETAMYPVYADQMHPFASQQSGDYPQPHFQPHSYATQPMMPQPMPMGVPYVYTPYAPAHLWQAQQAVPLGYYPYPQPPYGARTAYPQQMPALAAAQNGAADQASLEEIRASLREFREAVRELTESRSRRRHF